MTFLLQDLQIGFFLAALADLLAFLAVNDWLENSEDCILASSEINSEINWDMSNSFRFLPISSNFLDANASKFEGKPLNISHAIKAASSSLPIYFK
jgi:hypothetical protein